MNDNKKYLIAHLQSNDLQNRFTQAQVVSHDPNTGVRIGIGGSLSIVFKAIDKSNGQPVAIKFFDPDIQSSGAPFRMDLFERESKLLEGLTSSKRCLRLVQPLTYQPLKLAVVGGKFMNFTFQYFVTEWLENDVEAVFLNQHQYDDIAKLKIFRECCLSVFVLHNQQIAHRDIKPDNIRFADRNGDKVAVAIDLGTAAYAHSPQLGSTSDYSRQIGSPAYAPLEAHLGLSAVREVGVAADYHALGCLLYDLFNVDKYYHELLVNAGYLSCRGTCELHMSKCGVGSSDQKSLLREWNRIISLAKGQVTLPKIKGTSSSIRPSVESLLGRLLSELTAIDHRQRLKNPTKVLEIVDSAIRVLKNHVADKVKIARRKIRRDNRVRKELRRQQKLQEYLDRKSRSIGNG